MQFLSSELTVEALAGHRDSFLIKITLMRLQNNSHLDLTFNLTVRNSKLAKLTS